MAARARREVPQRWVLLYPQVPYRGAYPLQGPHDWVAALARREGFGVVDPTARLNTFNTHASWFDGHPNERAHHVLAGAMAVAAAGGAMEAASAAFAIGQLNKASASNPVPPMPAS